jgi:hypothetical protein
VTARRRRVNQGSRVNQGGLARLAGLLALAFAGVVAMPGVAAAETSLSVTTPADGHYQPGAPTPLLVTIKADRAVNGTLSASFDGTFAGSQRVDVPGGSAKEVVFIVTTPPWSSSGQISFTGDRSGDNASARINLIGPGADELIAVLPALTTGRDLPASAKLAIDLGLARLYPLDPELLAAGPEVLSPFSQLLVTPDDLEGLPPNQLDAVRSWIGTTGGTLVLDASPASSVPFDAEPVPGASDGSATFGVGQIRFTDGRAGTGSYDGLLQPTIPHGTDEFPFVNQFGAAPTTVLLAADAGVRIPAISALVGLLAVYTLVAGPILWLVLRQTRRETWVWALLPGLALITTLAVYGVGRALRHDASTAHATIVADLPATRTVSSQVLVTAPNGGRAGVALGSGWRPVSTAADDAAFGLQFGSSSSSQRLDGTNLVVDLPSGGVGVVTAETSLPAAEPSWGFDLHATDNGLEGTVTNRTETELSEISVTSGQGFAQVGRLGPGQSAEVTLRNANRPVVNSDPFMEHLMGRDPWSPNDGVVNTGAILNWLSRRPGLRAPGFVVAVGWTRDQPSPLRTTRGQTVVNGRTAYLTADRVDTGSGSQTAGLVELVRGSSTRVTDRAAANNQCGEISVTARLTAAANTTAPVLEVSTRSIEALDVWSGHSWVPTTLSELSREDDKVTIGLSEQLVADGPVYVRMLFSCDFWSTPDPFPQLRSATADEKVARLEGVTEQAAAPSSNGKGPNA